MVCKNYRVDKVFKHVNNFLWVVLVTITAFIKIAIILDKKNYNGQKTLARTEYRILGYQLHEVTN